MEGVESSLKRNPPVSASDQELVLLLKAILKVHLCRLLIVLERVQTLAANKTYETKMPR